MDPPQNLEEGRLLAEFSKVVYKGKDVKSEMQYGTIIVKNRKYHHYLYNVKDIDTSKPPIKDDSELTLTGPSASSIACPSGYLRIEVDLFFGTYKEAFRVDWLPSHPGEGCFYDTKTIEADEDQGKISIHFGMFCNAVEARIEVRLSPKKDFGGYVASVAAAHERNDVDSKFKSLLLSDPGSSEVKVQAGEPIMLNRSIVAVPLGYKLHLDIVLSNGEQHTIEFDVNDTEEKLVKEEDYDIKAKVIWNPIHETKPELNDICYYSDESYEH